MSVHICHVDVITTQKLILIEQKMSAIIDNILCSLPVF